MRNIWAILLRELKSYFVSPIAYVFTVVFLVVSGFFFYSILQWFNFQCMQFMQYPQYAKELNINEMVLRPLFHNMSVVFLMVIPFLTMRLFSEERRSGTDELLLTSPVTMNQIILGKFLGAMSAVLLILLLTGVYPAFAFKYSSPELGPILSGYLGLLLLVASFIPMGLLCSALTENQIVAAVLTFGVLLIFWVIGWSAESASYSAREIIQYMSITDHLEELTKGVIDTKDIVFYLSFSVFGLFLTKMALESRRWR